MRDLVLDMAIGPVSLALDRSGGTLALYEGKGKERRNECNVKVRTTVRKSQAVKRNPHMRPSHMIPKLL